MKLSARHVLEQRSCVNSDVWHLVRTPYTSFVNRAAAEHALLRHLEQLHRGGVPIDPQNFRIREAYPNQQRLASCVRILEAMGFENLSTGGGCTAWIFTRPDGELCMVTDGDCSAPKDTDKEWDVGFYKNDGDGEHYKFDHYNRGQAHGFIQAIVDIAKWRNG